jgi:uncharacterized protein DUF4340
MSRRALYTLLGALVVLTALVVVGQRTRTPASSAGAAFIPGLSAALNDVERVTLTKAGAETVATLERRGDTWVLVEKSAYLADVAKLRQNLLALADAKILETKTSNPELYARLGVADVTSPEATGVAVTLTAPGKELPTVILGDAEGNKYRYARRAGDTQSYLLDKDPDFPRNTSQWLAASIVDVRSDRVQQVTIKHADGETVIVSKAAPTAQNFEVASVPEGRELLYPGVANVIGNSLRELNLEDVEPEGTTEAAQQVEVEFKTFDGLVVRASGTELDDNAWISFVASFDPEQAARFAAPASTEAEASTEPAPEAAADQPAAATEAGAGQAVAPPAADGAAAEAERINARVGGWRYKVAGFQYDQMTRRMADLLKPPA